VLLVHMRVRVPRLARPRPLNLTCGAQVPVPDEHEYLVVARLGTSKSTVLRSFRPMMALATRARASEGGDFPATHPRAETTGHRPCRRPVFSTSQGSRWHGWLLHAHADWQQGPGARHPVQLLDDYRGENPTLGISPATANQASKRVKPVVYELELSISALQYGAARVVYPSKDLSESGLGTCMICHPPRAIIYGAAKHAIRTNGTTLAVQCYGYGPRRPRAISAFNHASRVLAQFVHARARMV
jgi:hypothetical protein